MTSSVNRHYAVALKQMRSSVALCCWAIGLALAAQVVVWSLLTFLDLRYETYEKPAGASSPSVVTPEQVRRQAIRSASQQVDDPSIIAAEVNRQRTKYDHLFMVTTTVASAVGIMGALGLLPLLGVGVVLAAGAGTTGVERAAAAFCWAILIVLLILPWQRFFGGIPFDGLFVKYETLASDVEFMRFGPESGRPASAVSQGLLFYGRYLVLPLGCLAGISAIGLRFRAGIESGLIPKPDLRLDPELEKEVAKIKATSYVGGGRAAGALDAAIKGEQKYPSQPPESGRSIRQISPGDRPSRII